MRLKKKEDKKGTNVTKNSVTTISDIKDIINENRILDYLDVGYFVIVNETLHLSDISQTLLSEKRKEISINEFVVNSNYKNPDYLTDLLKNASKIKRPHEFKFKYSVNDPKLKEVRIIKVIIDLSNQVSKYPFGIIKDISKENRQVKELIKSKEKAEESDKVKTTFLANISHQIRTPMNSILGFAELMSMSDANLDLKKGYLQIIKHQSNYLLKLIDDIGEMAKYEAGKLTITKIACNLDFLLEDVRVYFQKQSALKKQNKVDIKIIERKQELIVYTDAGRLQQVVTYLMNNAVKFTDVGSIELGYTPEDDKIQFYVRDTGQGFTKEEQKYLFDLAPTITEMNVANYDDINLDLKVARSIVKLLGGKIWVESEKGAGTTIYFTIPHEKIPKDKFHEEVSEEEHYLKEYTWKDKVILIVEDEEVNALFLEAVFQDTEAQIIYAKNGQQAIDLCKSINKIDLILMDIKMPKMNGIKATSEIRKFNKTVPIIAQTAMAGQEDIEQCLLAGCNETIIKPIEVEELMALISKYLGE